MNVDAFELFIEQLFLENLPWPDSNIKDEEFERRDLMHGLHDVIQSGDIGSLRGAKSTDIATWTEAANYTVRQMQIRFRPVSYRGPLPEYELEAAQFYVFCITAISIGRKRLEITTASLAADTLTTCHVPDGLTIISMSDLKEVLVGVSYLYDRLTARRSYDSD